MGHLPEVLNKRVPEGPHIVTWMGIELSRGMIIHQRRSGLRVVISGRVGSCDTSYDLAGWDIILIFPTPNNMSRLSLHNVVPTQPTYWSNGVGYVYDETGFTTPTLDQGSETPGPNAQVYQGPLGVKTGSWEYDGLFWRPTQHEWPSF